MKALKARMAEAEKKAKRKAQIDSLPPWDGGLDEIELPSMEEFEKFFNDAAAANAAEMERKHGKQS